MTGHNLNFLLFPTKMTCQPEFLRVKNNEVCSFFLPTPSPPFLATLSVSGALMSRGGREDPRLMYPPAQLGVMTQGLRMVNGLSLSNYSLEAAALTIFEMQ